LGCGGRQQMKKSMNRFPPNVNPRGLTRMALT
jgi:hypothetical protein